jgi:paraquat-inducible protein B
MTPSDPSAPEPLPEAVAAPRSRWRLPLVWLIPVIAALAGGWLAVKSVLDKGPTVTITFRTADGIEAKKTRIRYRDIDVGTVTQVTLREDAEAVIVKAELAKQAAKLLVDDTRFWVVRPRITGGGVSGLGTLFSGVYVGLDAGESPIERYDFVGLDVPPVLTSGQDGREFILKAEDLGSIGYGTPIYFRRLQVGSVTAFELDRDGRGVTVRIFVNAPYDAFVRTGSRFWHASGVDISLTAEGIAIDTESAASVLAGGLAFTTPPFAATSATAPPSSVFKLHANRGDAMREPDAEGVRFALVFAESVRGLKPGAAVEFRGIPIGEVNEISTRFVGTRERLVIPVHITIYPDRLRRLSDEKRAASAAERQASIDQLVAAGMRAQLRMGNLLTGQLYVALDFIDGAPAAKVAWSATPPELPTAKGELQELQSTVASLARKLDAVPYAQIAADLRNAIASLDSTLKSTEVLAKKLGDEVAPGFQATMVDVQATLADTRATLSAARRTLAADSALQVDLQTTLREVAASARALRELAETLERRPEALLRGKPETQEKTP